MPSLGADQSLENCLLILVLNLLLTFPCTKRFCAVVPVELKHPRKVNARECSELILGPVTLSYQNSTKPGDIHCSCKLTELSLRCMHSFYLKSCPRSAHCTYTKESFHCPHTGIEGLQHLPQVPAGSRCSLSTPGTWHWRGGGQKSAVLGTRGKWNVCPLQRQKDPCQF